MYNTIYLFIMNVKNLLLGAIEWLRSRVTAMKSEKGRWKRERLMADTGIHGLSYAVSAISLFIY